MATTEKSDTTEISTEALEKLKHMAKGYDVLTEHQLSSGEKEAIVMAESALGENNV